MVNELKQSLTLQTIKTKYSLLRGKLQAELKNNVITNDQLKTALKVYKLPASDYNILTEQYKETITNKTRGARTIDGEEIEIILNKASELLKRRGSFSRAIGLACITGRRYCEVLQSGDLYLLGDDDDQRYTHVLFKGQRKTGKDDIKPAYRIPLLLPEGHTVDDIVNAWDDLARQYRNKYIDLSYNDFNRATTSARRTVKEIYGDHYYYDDKQEQAQFSIKTLRAFYACVCAARFRQSTGDTIAKENAYIGEILGHGIVHGLNDLGKWVRVGSPDNDVSVSYQLFEII
jgi:hypothetical protein